MEDAINVRAVTTAIALLRAIYRRHHDIFHWGKSFDVLTGGPSLRTAIESGATTAEIVRTFEADLQTFDVKRPKRYKG